MVFNSPEQIYELIENPYNKEVIERGRILKRKHELHINGKGLDIFLQQIDQIENKQALDLRKRLAKAVTVCLTSVLTNPINKVFSAPGGLRYYDTKDDDSRIFLKQQLNKDFLNGSSLKDFVNNEWTIDVNIDPNGVYLLGLNQDGTPFIEYISIFQIVDYKYNSISDVEYLITHYELPNYTDNKDLIFYRAIDDNFDYIIQYDKKKKTYSVIDELTLKNFFGRVPAVVLSDNRDKLERYAKTSYIADALPLLDSYLLDDTIHEVYKQKMGVPYVWEMASACTFCNGTGEVTNKFKEGIETHACGHCEGSGVARERNISDKFYVEPFANGEQVPIPPAGFVQPDSSTHDIQVNELFRIKSEIFETIWGTVSGVQKNGTKATTAYEISVNKEPENAKLVKISKNAAKVEKAITDLLGEFYLKVDYNGSIIKYGTYYEFRTREQLWENYQNAKKQGINEVALNKLYFDYLQTEYEDNNIELERQTKIFNSTPYPHYQLVDVINFATQEEIEIKKNINEYIIRLENEKGIINSLSVQEIIEQFKVYGNENIS